MQMHRLLTIGYDGAIKLLPFNFAHILTYLHCDVNQSKKINNCFDYAE